METAQFFRYLFTMAGVTYLIRMLPLAVIRRRVTSPFLQAFLRYVPYAVLGAMTFPAVFTCAGSAAGSIAGLAVGLFANKEEAASMVKPDLTFMPNMSEYHRGLAMYGWHRAVERARGWVEQ